MKPKFVMDATENATETDNAHLNATQKAIIMEIKNNPYVTYDELAVMLKLNRSTIYRAIKVLINISYLRRVGGDKGGHWEIIADY